MLGATSSGGDVSGEDSDSSSSYSQNLDEFRVKWQKELHAAGQAGKLTKKKENSLLKNDNEKENTKPIDSNEEQAKFLFQQGVELESRGKVFEAMRLYRRAIQIVPDIELKMYELNTPLTKQETPSAILTDNKVENKYEKIEDDENLDGVDLIDRFQTAMQKKVCLFERANNDPNVITTDGLHISDLPVEIILYILRWVVSSDLDIRSLENCSMVSKGFYICAKDPKIWRLACVKIWGVNVGSLNCLPYTSWRQMFLERHRVHFNGCYISKTNYFRYGENSFQDQFYRPIQLIEYYRYIRFFPDGHILMMTSTDEPALAVSKLKTKHPPKKDILKGHFRLHGDMVIIVLNRTPQSYQRTNRRGVSSIENVENHTFFLELKIVSSRRRRFNQLEWKNYSIIQQKSENESSTDFEITPSKYPSLYFSRVKSYHLVSEHPLQ